MVLSITKHWHFCGLWYQHLHHRTGTYKKHRQLLALFSSRFIPVFPIHPSETHLRTLNLKDFLVAGKPPFQCHFPSPVTRPLVLAILTDINLLIYSFTNFLVMKFVRGILSEVPYACLHTTMSLAHQLQHKYLPHSECVLEIL